MLREITIVGKNPRAPVPQLSGKQATERETSYGGQIVVYCDQTGLKDYKQTGYLERRCLNPKLN